MIDTALQNRPPLLSSPFVPLPVGALRLTGDAAGAAQAAIRALTDAIDRQDGLFCPDSAYLGGSVYAPEMSAQLLSLSVCAAYSGEETLTAPLRRYAQTLLDTARPDGPFGPEQADLYDHALCLKALSHYYTLCGQRRVLAVMAQYFQYLALHLEQLPLSRRDSALLCEMLEPMLWLYNLAGYPFLRRLSAQISRLSPNWAGHFTAFGYSRDLKQAMPDSERDKTGRTYLLTDGMYNAAALKYPALLHVFLGGNRNEDAPAVGLTRMVQYHGQPQGLFSCDDHFSGLNPIAGVSTHALFLALDSLITLTALTGNAFFADEAERIAFNALPGAFTGDFSAMQRCGCANQTAAQDGGRFYNAPGDAMLFAPTPAGAPGGLLSFPRLMAMKQTGGLALLSYVDAKLVWVVNGTPVRILTSGGYPLKGVVCISVHVKTPVRFALSVRVPGWAQGASLRLDGTETALTPGGFHRIDRVWEGTTEMTLTLPMNPRVSYGFRQSAAVYCGALLMALPLTPSWNTLPDGKRCARTQDPWAIALSRRALEHLPDTKDGSLRLQAVPVRWATQENGNAGAPPVLPEAVGPVQTVTLLPFGNTDLRVSRFPVWEGESDG